MGQRMADGLSWASAIKQPVWRIFFITATDRVCSSRVGNTIFPNFASTKKEMPIKTQPSNAQWLEIIIEIDRHLHDALANFLIELGSNGIAEDEDIIDSPSENIKAKRNDRKPIRAYLKKDSQLQQKLHALNHYLKSLTKLHSLQSNPNLKLKTICEEDWNKDWQKFFTTARIGKHIIVKPPWERFLPEEEDLIIEINPGMAFGTGTHATTRMCLKAMEHLIRNSSKPIRSMLDVGTGSGILSIAAAKLGIPKIVGIDIDPIALTCAKQNIAKNHVADCVSIEEVSLKKVTRRFDLVVANILTEILIKLRNDLCSHLNKNGILILSGMLSENKSRVDKNFMLKKLSLINAYHDSDWVCMVFQKHI